LQNNPIPGCVINKTVCFILKADEMFSFLKSNSIRIKLWVLIFSIQLFVACYAVFLLYLDNIQGLISLFIYFVVICFSIVVIIINRIFLSNLNKKIYNTSDEISKSCKHGDDYLLSIKNNLTKFISLTGSQLDGLNESAKLMNNISEMLTETTSNAEVCKEMSDKVTRDVNDGNEIMQKMVDAVLTIEKTKDDLSEISNLIKQISNDTSTIHTIVSTTELLSLNASIEAAKAGEKGKGFSVVAEEVGNLAKLSGREAKEIEGIILKSQNEIFKIIELNQSRVDLGKKASSDALAVFTAIKSEMFGISSRSENIRAATWEQKIGIDQMAQGNFDIKNILKKNITDTVNLLKVYNLNFNNFNNIKEVADILKEYWSGEHNNDQE
jgi:methyl-accepting chemotaxis protein